MADIADALAKDPRVTDISKPEGIEDAWCGRISMFPAPAVEDGLISSADAFKVLDFNKPLAFSVTVPEKNQPKKRETDPLPTAYRAFWDGMFLLVTWRFDTNRSIPLSGGHVVSEVLADALKRLGYRLYPQGCNPFCTHEFAHTDIRFLRKAEQKSLEYVECPNWTTEVHALSPDLPDEELGDLTFRDLRGTARNFTRLKNFGRRILESEQEGRKTLDALMEIYLSRSEVGMLSWRGRFEAEWKTRGWFREARLFIARVWIVLANIEALRREWERFRLEFEGRARLRGREKMFVKDYADEVDRVQSLDLDLMRAGVQEIAERLDSRALMRVTAVAAIAGAVAGGIVGGFAGNLL